MYLSDKISQSHETLIKKYAEILDQVPTLPFDRLSVFKIYLSKTFSETCNHIQPGLIRIPAKIIVGFTLFLSLGFLFISYLLAKIPVMMRFISDVTLKSHIKSKLNEIRHSYIFKYSQIANNTQTKKQKNWFDTAIKDCENLSSTINHTLFSIITKASGGFGLLLTIFKSLNSSEGLDSEALIGFIYIFLSLAFFPFIFKRTILLQYNIYQLENNLFEAIEKNKNKEFPIDLCVLIIAVITAVTDQMFTEGDLGVEITFLIMILIASTLFFRNRKFR
jgi:hypothetical protein